MIASLTDRRQCFKNIVYPLIFFLLHKKNWLVFNIAIYIIKPGFSTPRYVSAIDLFMLIGRNVTKSRVCLSAKFQ